MAIVGQVCLGISVDVRCPAWRAGICPFAEAAKRALDGFAGARLEEMQCCKCQGTHTTSSLTA